MENLFDLKRLIFIIQKLKEMDAMEKEKGVNRVRKRDYDKY